MDNKALDTDVARRRALRASLPSFTIIGCSNIVSVGPPRGSTWSLCGKNIMSDRTEEEEERYIRAVARRMPVQPERLFKHLKKHDFALIYANRDEGVNEIYYLRTTPGLSGFFDNLKIKSNIFGEGA